jgi:hypothetical protein
VSLKLPPWTARNERERELMFEWVNRQLDRIADQDFIATQSKLAKNFDVKKHFAWVDAGGPEIEQADHGDIEPLRKKLPQYARFLRLPKRQRGQRFSKMKSLDPVAEALADVKRIRRLWSEKFGKKNRHVDDGYTAEEIAARRWGIRFESIIRRMKNPPRKRANKKKAM